jgi:hypothetical protein
MKIVFCLPGQTYSRDFLLAWTDLVMKVSTRGHQVMVSQNKDKTSCVSGGDVLFQGQDYDVVMWIGQDAVFIPDDFFNLLESPHDVTAGIYMAENLQNFDVVSQFSPDFPKGKYLRPEDIVGSSQYLKVDYAGMNWMLVRKGVFEKFPAPYIWSTQQDNEEMNFCKMAGEVYIDTKIRVGNQKRMIL